MSGRKAEPTDDGHYVVIDGRRWRATDPNIPEKLRAELVSELMRARRGVKDHGDSARHRVQDAKVALGERGEKWWDDPTADGRAERITATIRALLRNRSETSSICPSDVARVIGGERWRDEMDAVRDVAAGLAADGTVRITQGDDEVDLATARGPVRIRRGPAWQ